MVQAAMGPTPGVVGQSFVKQYYTVLTTNPDVLHRFYTDKSSLTHGENLPMPDHDIPIMGQQEIHEKLLSHGFDDCRAELTFVDCQKTLEDGVVILMHGFLTNRGMKPRRFTQVIVLAVQENGYYVQNDILRFLDPPQKDDPMMNFKQDDQECSEHMESLSLSPPSPQKSESDNMEPESVAEHFEPSNSSTQQASPTTRETNAPTNTPTTNTPSTNTPTTNAPTNPTPTPPTTTPPPTPGSAPSSPSAGTQCDNTTPQQPHPRFSARTGPSAQERQVAPRSIFVGNLPVNEVDEDKLKQVFSSHASIVEVNVVPNKTFAFIEFETEEMTAAVLSHSSQNEFFYLDRRLNVFPKRLGGVGPRSQRRGDYDHNRRGRGHWHRRGNRGRGRGAPYRTHEGNTDQSDKNMHTTS